ncbi:MAG: Cysteine desulfurase, SufS family [Parcubacteria group bacterium GW2011_GWA2_49_9]|nr:MAG: Cysteine desulfurase, SufS family [Parcubacteria group bacterium GW2011_GWA2_49_9]
MQNIRAQFPILKRKVNGKPLAYFDNAATTQKPVSVIDALTRFYREANAPVHRSVYSLGVEATERYEEVRTEVQKFINAKHAEEIIFTGGATESLNIVASSFSEAFLKAGDTVLVGDSDHHAVIVPWQAVAEKKKLKLTFIPVADNGVIDLAAYKTLLKTKPKFVALTYISNVLGVINPVKEMTALAHKAGAAVMIDAAQSVAHTPIDVQKLNCDFLAFSGHKMYGPTGVGVLYGKKELLERMPPRTFGGNMIAEVTREKTTYAPLPAKFEAGTPPIAEVIGLGEAIRFIQKIGFKAIQKTEGELTAYALKSFAKIPELSLLGSKNAQNRIPVFSFIMCGVHPHDIATLLDREGISVRAGHHCAEVLHRRFSITASVRASLTFYNTKAEIDRLREALIRTVKKFNG